MRVCPCLVTRSTAFSTGSLASMATRSVRGTITSRTRMSPISKMPWIISRSSSSRTPSSSPTETSIFNSSSVTNGPRTWVLPPSMRRISRVIAVRTNTTGRITQVAPDTSRAIRNATRSARCSEIVLGVISQRTRTASDNTRLTSHSGTRSWYRRMASSVAADDVTGETAGRVYHLDAGGALGTERVGDAHQGAAGRDQVIHDDGIHASHVADHALFGDDVVFRASLVDKRDRQVEQPGQVADPLCAADVRRDDDRVRQVQLANVIDQEFFGRQVVHRNIEKALDGVGMEIEGEHPVRPGEGNDIGH